MRQIAAIIHYNLREIVKDRFFYGLLVFALFLLAFGIALGTATFGAEAKIVKDAGLAAADLFGVLLVVLLVIGGVSREMERRTVFVALTKPMPRGYLVVGKYLAAVVAASVLTLLTGIITVGVNVLIENRWAWEILLPVYYASLELALVGAVALFFIMVSTPILSGLLTLFFYVIGHTIYEVRQIAEALPKRDLWMKSVVDAAYWVLPDLERFNARADVLSQVGLFGAREGGYAFLYALGYASFFVWLAVLIFARKDVK